MDIEFCIRLTMVVGLLAGVAYGVINGNLDED